MNPLSVPRRDLVLGLILATTAGVVGVDPVIAGPNSLGTLIVHVRPGYVCTECPEICASAEISSCEEAVTNLPDDQAGTWWVFVNFPSGSEPRLSSVSFGIDYEIELPVLVVASGSCGDFESSTSNWPEPGEGTTVSWEAAQTALFQPIYWFTGYSYYFIDSEFSLLPHPTVGGYFTDDSVPAQLDPIADYGVLGFWTEPGYLPCTSGGLGACCLEDGSCTFVSEGSCGNAQGLWVGLDVECDPNPCPPAGACCLADRSCHIRMEDVCVDQGGGFRGVDTVCDPDPCPQSCEPFALHGRANTRLPRPDQDPFAAISSNLTGREGTGSGSARIGSNPDGVLVLHAESGLVYSTDDDYCGVTSVSSCEDVVPTLDTIDPAVLHVLAVFPESTEPRVAGVTFGVEYDPCVQLLDWGPCATFEIPESNWPESGSGTSLAWETPLATQVSEIYWFAAYVELPQIARMSMIPHPSAGAFFVDDSFQSDPISGLGVFGFYSPGEVPCRQVFGACCRELDCRVLSAGACFRAGGDYQGDNATCDPDPCGPVPVVESSWGRIKASFRE